MTAVVLHDPVIDGGSPGELEYWIYTLNLGDIYEAIEAPGIFGITTGLSGDEVHERFLDWMLGEGSLTQEDYDEIKGGNSEAGYYVNLRGPFQFGEGPALAPTARPGPAAPKGLLERVNRDRKRRGQKALAPGEWSTPDLEEFAGQVRNPAQQDLKRRLLR